MTKFVQVLINIPGLADAFDYHVPPEFDQHIGVGSLVQVSFGKQNVQGVVTGFIDIPSVVKTKPIQDLLFNQPVITPAQLDLVKWMARETLSDLSSCLGLMLPGGVSKTADSLYTIVSVGIDYPLSPLQRLIIAYLKEKGALTGRQLTNRFRRQDWRRSILSLVQRGLIQKEPFLAPPSVKPKMVRAVMLNCDPDAIPEAHPGFGKSTIIKNRRKEVLTFLATQSVPVHVQVVLGKTGANQTDLKRLAEAHFIKIDDMETIRDPLDPFIAGKQKLPELTMDQREVWHKVESILEAKNFSRPVILHGVTGSGKTEIYLRAVDEVIKKQKQALVMVPEISLTPQTVQRFQSRFPGKVGIIHSKLSEGERFDTWRRVLSGELSVIVGPRSAMFMPFERLGIIILDEVHDDSYFQDDVQPRYSTLRTAKAYGLLVNALVIYGSATPGVEMMYRAAIENWPVLKLPNRVLAHLSDIQHGSTSADSNDVVYLPLPAVNVVDMRAELKSGNKSIFSRALMTQLESVLAAGNQAILFLNRRGSATYVFCRDCGFRLDCPRCELALTYHANEDNLVCHHCNYRRQLPTRCPACGSVHIRQFGLGTEKVEQEVKRLFPFASVIRLDSGVTQHKGAHSSLLSQFANRQADIMVGTQMLAKGIDLPHVTLVGVMLAEIGLGLPDFRAAERTFQLLTQVAGRAGRSPLGGKAIFQTYQPDHYAIQKASKHDFSAFYQQEIEMRRKMDYPPFSRLLTLEFRSRENSEARDLSVKAAELIQHKILQEGHIKTVLSGPVPCFFHRIAGMYRWQIIIRGPKPVEIIHNLDLPLAIITVDPISLL